MGRKRVFSMVVGIVVLVVALGVIIQGFVYNRFFKVSDKVQRIPGLAGGFVPQGVTRLGDDGMYLVCGYLDGGKPSRLYLLDGKGGSTLVYMEKEDGSTYTGHAGGITAAGEFIYISNASKLFVLDVDDVLGASDGGTVRFMGHVDVPCRASFCSCDGKMVYVGDYHAAGYETAANHRIQLSDGSFNEAVTYGYALSPNEEFGIEEKPSMAFSTCDKVQGFAVVDGKAYLSCSAGFRNSKLRIYDAEGSDAVLKSDGVEIPLVLLDGGRAVDVVTMPNRSEDLDYRGGCLLVGFEGAARKFGLGIVPFSMTNVMAVDIDKL